MAREAVQEPRCGLETSENPICWKYSDFLDTHSQTEILKDCFIQSVKAVLAYSVTDRILSRLKQNTESSMFHYITNVPIISSFTLLACLKILVHSKSLKAVEYIYTLETTTVARG